MLDLASNYWLGILYPIRLVNLLLMPIALNFEITWLLARNHWRIPRFPWFGDLKLTIFRIYLGHLILPTCFNLWTMKGDVWVDILLQVVHRHLKDDIKSGYLCSGTKMSLTIRAPNGLQTWTFRIQRTYRVKSCRPHLIITTKT